jgi:hypothetical protein
MSSLVTVPLVHDVATMDKLTTQELNRLVIEEQTRRGHNDLGHLLPTIFQSFTVQPPLAKDLLIPLYQILHRNKRINKLFRDKAETDLVPLWDIETKKWNWALPSSHKEFNKRNQARANPPGTGRMTTEEIFVAFFNVLTTALARHNELSSLRSSGNRIWSGAHSTVPIRGENIPRKPDIIMSDDLNPGWAEIKVVAELTSSEYKPAERVAKSLDTKAYLILRHQPWRRFALMMSFCNKYRELRVHTYDRSGSAISPYFDIQRHKDAFVRAHKDIIFPFKSPRLCW